ncbi:uncharacterized protein LOC115822226 [Chanos chanos]|uniref:Uncharacterized protein LOC115822226 n=1 Tax=Chanos chanos TaxID=29144 RepID=A0A6J2WEL7_CHACN|nr:uncharacterized protein LOC115822226 [Chanos chanos]
MGGAYLEHEFTPELLTRVVAQIDEARKRNPNCTYLAALYLVKLAEKNHFETEESKRQAKVLVDNMDRNLDNLGHLLRFYRLHVSLDSAIAVAEKALTLSPESCDVKKKLAICYKWKIFYFKGNIPSDNPMIRDAINLYEKVTGFYPDYLQGKMDLATLYGISDQKDKADEIYTTLLEGEAEMKKADLQRLYYSYSNYLHWRKAVVGATFVESKISPRPGLIKTKSKEVRVQVKTEYK